jgi:hypothetical protein
MAATLKFNFLADASGLRKGISNANKQLSGFEKATKKASNGIKSALGGIGLGIGISSLVSGLRDATVGFEKAQIASAKLSNVLNEMGVGYATARVDAYAESLQNTIAVDADFIKATQTKLATFSELNKTVGEAGGIFDRATLAAYDLAAAGFGSAEQNAVQLGKALQDPIKGLTSLARSGVTFTAVEKAKIKTLVQSNKTLEAQNIVLEAIEKQVGGTALAGVSQFARLQLIFESLGDILGEVLLPYVKQFADYLASEEGAAYMRNLVENIGKVILGLANSVTWLTKNYEWIKNIALMWAAVTVGIKAAQIAMGVYSIATGTATIATANLGKVMKKSGWLALALILGSLAADQLTAEPDYGDLSIPEIPDPSQFIGPPTGLDPITALTSQIAGLANVDGGKAIAKVIDPALERMKNAAKKMQEYAKSFRDSVDLAFGLNESETRFSAEKFIRQLRRVTEAAKKLPTLLQKIRDTKATGSTALVNELAGMNPLQAATIAEGLLGSGKLNEIGSLRNQLSTAGMQTALVGAGAKTYNINVNKANMSAAEIIAAIKSYERSTGKKVLLG